MIPAGLTDMNIEFFAKKGELYSMQDGKRYMYPDLPEAHLEFLVMELGSDHAALATMTDADDRLKLYGTCRFGAINSTPDLNCDGKVMDHDEYYDCGQRKHCPHEGRRCKEILTDNGVLSTHQVQIMIKVARGLLNKEIADQLQISENTVHNHVANIILKIGGRNRVDIAMYVKERGIA
jgi:DNA-binding CsgD family transcriptional regulator